LMAGRRPPLRYRQQKQAARKAASVSASRGFDPPRKVETKLYERSKTNRDMPPHPEK